MDVSPWQFLASYGMPDVSVSLEKILTDLKVMHLRASAGFQETKLLNSIEEVRVDPSFPYGFQAVGDPMIVVSDKQGNEVARKHYYGPAVIILFDEEGRLKYLDFVGVCDIEGNNRNKPNADYVGEQARLYVQSGEWKYRDGCGKGIAELSDSDWRSEKPHNWRPPPDWLMAFQGGKTFVLHAYQPRILDGPSFDTVWAMATAPELTQLHFNRHGIHEWISAMLLLVSTAQAQGVRTEKAEELLKYAVMYGLAMTGHPYRALPTLVA